MKKKTKERLDRMEKRLQQLVEDVQELKGLSHHKKSDKDRNVKNVDASNATVKAAQGPLKKTHPKKPK